MLKKPESETVGKTVSEAFYGKSGVSITEKVIADKQDISKEIELKFWDGRVAEVLAVVNCIRSVSGETLGAVVCLADLAEIKRHQRLQQEQQTRIMHVDADVGMLVQIRGKQIGQEFRQRGGVAQQAHMRLRR